MITAAGAAPGVRHRWASLAHLLHSALGTAAPGQRLANPTDLQKLLDACVVDEPRLAQLEDFVPVDPREEVLFRLDNTVRRLFPGSVERPIANVRRACSRRKPRTALYSNDSASAYAIS